ncbi:isoaspartyl peptidase/L-asparaginase family protein [Flavobacterium sp. NRK F7]|uniref:isoaspartyl peptidase/L-asparaginase family protein n=1 Tax=Flavobacterium sp. NRK F7 TaxID=2954930 RepID=UPI002091C783|nr:isoaspartyl peptidase/L-asparaginase [Flavobacterium sp. NRK F7]MCO6164084.1 isoaspartyl peptidase/L-asparaginase [Flavobacterium sp. NRK F7]
MKRIVFLIFLVAFSQCKSGETNPSPTSTNKIAIVIHGGAGTILKENLTPELEQEYKKKLEEAVRTGYKILQNGGSSLDAVEKTIRVLEDSPLFNAGKGAVFTNQGKNELDASIMDGKSLKAGAIAGVTTVKNPITLARTVMEKSEHVLLAREGADFFAAQNGLELVDPSYFYVENRYQSLLRAKEKEKIELDHDDKAEFYDPTIKDSKYGTVGCVALDKNGNIAAGTSTGGMTNKKWGRIGDAPIIGAGTYANNSTCGVSATGWGEFFIRNVVAYDIAALMDYKKRTLEKASQEVIQKKLTQLGGTGGIIALDKKGTIVMEFNTPGMYRAAIDSNGKLTLGIYKENE